jgi:hypothetical protein
MSKCYGFRVCGQCCQHMNDKEQKSLFIFRFPQNNFEMMITGLGTEDLAAESIKIDLYIKIKF